MSIEKVSIDEMIIGMSSEAKRLGFSDTFIWADFIPRLRKFAVWYDRQGLVWYDPVVTHKIVEEHKERFNKGEYSADAFSRVKTSARRLNEFYLTGTFRVYMPRRGTRYVIRSENEHLISAFIEWKKYGPNTRDDVRWVLRKYFYYLEEKKLREAMAHFANMFSGTMYPNALVFIISECPDLYSKMTKFVAEIK